MSPAIHFHQLTRSRRLGGHGPRRVAVISLLSLSACSPAGEPESPRIPWAGLGAPSPAALPPLDSTGVALPETETDWAIARGTIEWAKGADLERLGIGKMAAVMATRFIGVPYVPGSLELEGPERLVVNLRAFDCVTLVEHVLVLARLTAAEDPSFLGDEDAFRERYRSELASFRYRSGVLDGYGSRLHYFSEWIEDADAKGLLRNLTARLGGVVDGRPIDFMSANVEAYRQLGEDEATLAQIRALEENLTHVPRFFIPQDEIREAEGEIQDGDVIAAVSALEGLDIAHTGIAVWREGRLHLLHAPLVGDSVELSARPLAERVRGIEAQVGIMVARPLEP